MNKLEETLDLYLGQKAPQIPPNARETIVKIVPWLTAIFVVLSIPALLILLGFSAALLPFATAGAVWSPSSVLMVANLVLEALSLPGLFKRTRQGWLFAFYAVLVYGLQQLLDAHLGNFIISTLLGLYLLFQIRSYYK